MSKTLFFLLFFSTIGWMGCSKKDIVLNSGIEINKNPPSHSSKLSQFDIDFVAKFLNKNSMFSDKNLLLTDKSLLDDGEKFTFKNGFIYLIPFYSIDNLSLEKILFIKGSSKENVCNYGIIKPQKNHKDEKDNKNIGRENVDKEDIFLNILG